MDGKNKAPFSFTTLSNPEWDKKIEAGLLKECAALTSSSVTSKTHHIYVKHDDTFVGGIKFEQHAHILWVDSIWIEPPFRKQGVGRALLQEAHLFAIQNKVQEMQLNTYFQEAHTFFLTCGFEDVAVIPNWKWGLTCYLMRKMQL